MERTITVLPASIQLMALEISDWIRKTAQLQSFTEWRFFKTSNGPPQVFRWKVEFIGATWTEDFTFDIPSDPLRDFPNDVWRDSQLIGLRELRTWMLSILLKYPQLESLKYEVS